MILKRTQSIAHNKNTRKGPNLSLHPTPPHPHKKKKVLMGMRSLPFCITPLEANSMDSAGDCRLDTTASQKVKKHHKVPNQVSPLGHSATLAMSAFQKWLPHGATRQTKMSHCVAMPGGFHLVLIRGHVLWPRIISGRVFRRVLNFNTFKWCVYFPFQSLAAWSLKVFLFLPPPRNDFKIKRQTDAYSSYWKQFYFPFPPSWFFKDAMTYWEVFINIAV